MIEDPLICFITFCLRIYNCITSEITWDRLLLLFVFYWLYFFVCYHLDPFDMAWWETSMSILFFFIFFIFFPCQIWWILIFLCLFLPFCIHSAGVLHDWTLLLYGTQPHPVKTHEGPTHCEEGQYLVSNITTDTVIHECQTCHNACLTCYGADNGQCVHCSPDLEKDGSYCLKASASSSPHFHTSSWLVIGGCIVILSLAFFLLFFIIFGSLQAAEHGYCVCSGKDWISSSDSDDFNYRQLMKLEEQDEDEEETLLSVQKTAKLPPLWSKTFL